MQERSKQGFPVKDENNQKEKARDAEGQKNGLPRVFPGEGQISPP
jgi:hypothetical protein